MKDARFPFLVIEGLDGSGKTTLRKGMFRIWQGVYQITPLCILTTNYLAPEYAPALVAGKYSPSRENREDYVTALIADKQRSLESLVEPVLASRPVIADRWVLSEIAFLAVKHGMKPEHTHHLLRAGLSRVPDLTLVLHASLGNSLGRVASRPGTAVREDWDVREVQERIEAVYEAVVSRAKSFPLLGDVVRLDATGPPEQVLFTAWTALAHRGLVPPRSCS